MPLKTTVSVGKQRVLILVRSVCYDLKLDHQMSLILTHCTIKHQKRLYFYVTADDG